MTREAAFWRLIHIKVLERRLARAVKANLTLTQENEALRASIIELTTQEGE